MSPIRRRTCRGTDDGFIAAGALVAVAAAVCVLLAASALLETASSYLARSAAGRRTRQEARALVETVLSRLERDPTPAGDSVHDPLWTELPQGVTVSEPLPEHRCIAGLRCRSRYAYLNVNAAPLRSLEAVAAARLRDPGSAERFIDHVDAARVRGELLSDAALRLALGEAWRAVTPVITAEPVVNANTAPPGVLEALLAEAMPHADSRVLAERILAAREEQELGEEDLVALTGSGGTERLDAVLGVRALTYRLLIEVDGRGFEAILARVPRPGAAEEYRVVRFAELQRW